VDSTKHHHLIQSTTTKLNIRNDISQHLYTLLHNSKTPSRHLAASKPPLPTSTQTKPHQLRFRHSNRTMPAPSPRSLDLIILNAHRAKGIRYPTAARKESFKTWYSYALRRGEAEKTSQRQLLDYGRSLRHAKMAAPEGGFDNNVGAKLGRDLGPGGRTYL
jgi:hypothetical protein